MSSGVPLSPTNSHEVISYDTMRYDAIGCNKVCYDEVRQDKYTNVEKVKYRKSIG